MKNEVSPGVVAVIVVVLILGFVLAYRHFAAPPNRVEDSTTVFKRPGGPPPGTMGAPSGGANGGAGAPKSPGT